MSVPFVTASHAELFEEDALPKCDVCGAAIDAEDDEGAALPGRALYVSARGDAVTYDDPPLCSACAVAIGVTAIQRWDVEEDEG